MSISAADLVEDEETGEFIYNASFGSNEDGADPVEITDSLIDEGQNLIQTVVFSVDSALSWNDDDGDGTVSTADELSSFSFGKPGIVEFTLEAE